MGRKHKAEGQARGYTPNEEVANRLAAAIEKANAATAELREITREANESIKDSRNAGEVIASRIVKEFETVGAPALINAAVAKWLKLWDDELHSRMSEMEKRFVLYDRVMDAQGDRAGKTLAIMEQWVARFYAIAGTEKFRAMARKLVGDEMQGPTGDPFHQVREDSRAFLNDGSKEGVRVVDSDSGFELTLNLESGAIYARPLRDIPADNAGS